MERSPWRSAWQPRYPGYLGRPGPAFRRNRIGYPSLVRHPGLTSDDLIRGFWVGFAFVLLLLQLWNLRWPVTAGAFGLVALLGIFGLAWSAEGLQQWFRACIGASVGSRWWCWP